MIADFIDTPYGQFSAAMSVARLDDLCEKDGGVQTGPFGSQLHQEDYVPVGTPIITVEHLGENRILQENLPRITNEDRDRLSRYQMRQGDIIFSRVGSVDRRALVRTNEDGWLFSGRCLRVRPDPKKIDPAYLSYFFGLSTFKAHIRSIAVGATMPSINTQILSGVPIVYPQDIDAQRAIAHILGTLDDKIELNRRMNETLEAMARAIFKSWFVDFDPVRAKASGEPPESICRRLGLTPDVLALFPDGFQGSELGEVPEGWSIRKVEDISQKIGMGPFGSNIKVSTFVEDGIPVISGQHLNKEMLDDNTYKFVSTEHASRLASSNVGRGDVIFTHAGSIGQVSYIPDHSRYERYVLSQRQFYMRCDASKVSHLFMTYFFRSPFGQHLLLANASQVGVPSIARPVSYLKSIELVTPPKNILDRFDVIVRAFHHRVSANRREIGTIANVRDSLLPRLLSGDMQKTTKRSREWPKSI